MEPRWNPHGTPLEPSRKPPGTPPGLRLTCCVLRGMLRIRTHLSCNAFFSKPSSAHVASFYARSCESWPPQQLITFAFLSSSPKKERAQVNGRSRQCIRYHGKHVCSHTSIHVFTTCARRLRTQSHLDILACMRGCHVCTACAREVARAQKYLRTCADVCTFVRCIAKVISHVDFLNWAE